MDDFVNKRTILIAAGTESRGEELARRIRATIGNAMIFHAKDGSDALAKIRNAPPNVVLVEEKLPKLTGTKIVEWILANSKIGRVGTIILSDVPEHESFADKFVDEVVRGQVQFLGPTHEESQLEVCLSRALNFAASDDEREFRLRFLGPGEHLLREGEKAKSVFILRQGNLKAVLHREEREVLLGSIEPGEFVGEMAYINGEDRSADVIATISSELIEIPVDCLDLVLFRKPAWAKALMRTLSKRVRSANARQDASGND